MKRRRNDVANKLKYAKKKFFSHLTPSNPKSFWKTTKVLTKGISRIPFLKDDSGKIITDDTAKATTLNDFFLTALTCALLLFQRVTGSSSPILLPASVLQNCCAWKNKYLSSYLH